MQAQIFHGDIVFAEIPERLSVQENSYLVTENGLVNGIYSKIPEKYEAIPITDYGRALIIPAFSDLHIHASQFLQRGTGTDALLFDWLNNYTFVQEANFSDIKYAKVVYDAAIHEMIRQGTFHASLFTTIHYDASDYLFRAAEKAGMYAYVGKVNMDQNSPEYLCESTEESLLETERFIAEHQSAGRVRTILTPRFAPTCSEKLIMGLGKIADKYACGIQTHLCESKAEVQSALELFPDYQSDAEIYERAGLLEHGPSIFAHFIFPSERDIEILQKAKSVTVHCPDATTNVTAGIMPVAALKTRGINISLGSDIGAGQSTAVYRQVARAVQLSKLKEFYEPEGNRRITFEEAFYMATSAGGSAFGKIGSFKPGYHFNALVLDGLEDKGFFMNPQERLERFCYAGDDRNIIARYIDGRMVVLSEL